MLKGTKRKAVALTPHFQVGRVHGSLNMTAREILAKKYSAEHAERYHRNRYGDFQGRINHAFMRRALLRSLALVAAGSHLLDVPCGTGQFCWDLARAGYRVTGMDVSEAMLDCARLDHSSLSVTLRRGDIFDLPFPNKAFDAAVCIRFTNLVDARLRIRAVRELTRVACVVVISYYHCYSLKYVSRLLRYALKLRARISLRHSRQTLARELHLADVKLQKLVRVMPVLSEAWLAVVTANPVKLLHSWK